MVGRVSDGRLGYPPDATSQRGMGLVRNRNAEIVTALSPACLLRPLVAE